MCAAGLHPHIAATVDGNRDGGSQSPSSTSIINTWFRQWRASAHAFNLIPLALLSTLSVFAAVTHTAGHVAAGSPALLAALIGLVVFCVVAAARSARCRALFWLAVLVNPGLTGALVYLRFCF